MIKKLWIVLSFLLVVALVLSACGPSETPTEEPVVTEEPMETEEPEEKMEPEEEEEMMTLEGTITLWHALKESEAPGLNAAIESFQAEYPDVTFDVLYVPDTDLRGKYETAAATGGGPSLMLGFQDWGPALYEAELVTDLGDLASLDFLQTINQAALGSVRYDEALVGMPFGLKGVVMFRNTSIVPEAATSFEDLVSKAQAATEGDVLGANLEYGHFFAFAHLNALGGQLMNEAGDPLFNDDKGVEWLNLLNSFKDAGPVEWYTDNDVNLF
ncbi:MAG: extracellular solute-binding protein, partial [Anaerolineales bacterium]